jgi:hypothetical protein
MNTSESNVSIQAFFEMKERGQILSVDGASAVLSRPFFVALLRPVLLAVRFDSNFYREINTDLADAERSGALGDLHEHYLNFGFFEDRLPCRVEVDGRFYARAYPDVAVAILEERVKSAQQHFDLVGFREGRLPRAGWSFTDLIREPVPA